MRGRRPCQLRLSPSGMEDAAYGQVAGSDGVLASSEPFGGRALIRTPGFFVSRLSTVPVDGRTREDLPTGAEGAPLQWVHRIRSEARRAADTPAVEMNGGRAAIQTPDGIVTCEQRIVHRAPCAGSGSRKWSR